ncbi:hypothetical protein, partial [Klebsiella pneumoniae]
ELMTPVDYILRESKNCNMWWTHTNSFISGVMIYTIDNLPWIKERLNWQKESTHLALNQIISIYLTGSGMAIISRITPLYFYRHPLSR